MLCPACDAYRFPPPPNCPAVKSSRAMRNDVATIQVREIATDSDNKSSKSAVKSVTAQLEVNDVLCFVKNKYDNHPATIIKESICDTLP